MKVRIKVGDSVDMEQRNIRRVRQRLQLIGGQIAVLRLDRPQLLEDVRGACHE